MVGPKNFFFVYPIQVEALLYAKWNIKIQCFDHKQKFKWPRYHNPFFPKYKNNKGKEKDDLN